MEEAGAPRWLERLLALRGPYAFLIAFAPGFLLVITSILVGVHDFVVPKNATYVPVEPGQVPVARQVGFLAAPNWSINYLLLLPLAAYLMLEVLAGFRDALDRLYEREMVRDASFNVLDDRRVVISWVAGTRLRRVVLIVFALVTPLAYSLTEWFTNNFLRVFEMGGPKAEPPDYDWGLRALVEGWSPVGRALNVGFDLFAFACQALLLVLIIGFFLVCLDLARALNAAPKLVPDLRSDHGRRGFEDFEEPLQQLLIVTLISYLMCYFIRLENVYLASAGFASLGDFVIRDIVRGVGAAKEEGGLNSALAALFTVSPAASRQSFMAWSAAFLVLLFTFMVVVMTVHSSARRARDTALRRLMARGGVDRSLFGGSLAEERERLETMDIWPLGYLSLNLLVLVALVALVTLFFYRIGLFVFGFVVMLVLLRLGRRMMKTAALG